MQALRQRDCECGVLYEVEELMGEMNESGMWELEYGSRFGWDLEIGGMERGWCVGDGV